LFYSLISYIKSITTQLNLICGLQCHTPKPNDLVYLNTCNPLSLISRSSKTFMRNIYTKLKLSVTHQSLLGNFEPTLLHITSQFHQNYLATYKIFVESNQI